MIDLDSKINKRIYFNVNYREGMLRMDIFIKKKINVIVTDRP